MHQGWRLEKLKDVAQIIGGSTPKTEVKEFWGGQHYWVTPAELDGSKYISSTARTITDLAVQKSNLTLMPEGTVLLSSRAPIGKVAITTVPMFCNQGFKNIVCGRNLHNVYVYYFLKHNVDYLQSLGTGATFKEISKRVVENVCIPFPSLDEQRIIASELDLLSDIIEKKGLQLRDFDLISDSLFYELIGDPVTNDRGWPISQFGELCNSELGKMLDSKRASGEKKPYLCTINVLWDRIDLSTQKEMLIEEDEFERYSVRKGDLLICEGGDIGRSAIWDRDDEMYYQNSLHRVRFDETKMLPEVMLYIFKILKDRGELDQYGKGQTIRHLVKKSLLSIPVPVPDIQVQRTFAEKLTAIKNNKALVQQSLVSTQLLFESRMNKYFND